jgi:DNA-binding SARP family transcriptional activator/basic membrane lipoprotein Med (substrate-binding protein (PBP1-ABC) superfamily)
MEFRLLGPLEVVAEDGRPISLGGSRARALLALLLLHRNETLALDRIVDELWADAPPKTAGQAVRVYVSQLRKALEPDRSETAPRILVTRGNGYVLCVDPDAVDVDRFDALRIEGRRLLGTGGATRAADVLDEALALWRGPPLQDFTYDAFAQPEIARLEELRLATLEDLFDAQLVAGHDSDLVADLEPLVEANPVRERLRAQLMLALYRSGRQADALEVYQRGRRLLREELGLDPGESLRRLEARILQQDPALDRPSVTPHPAERQAAPPPRSRRAKALLIMAALAAAAAVAAVLTDATAGHSHRRPKVVTLVLAEPRPAANSLPSALDPTRGLLAGIKGSSLRAKIRYGGDTGSFLRAVAGAARISDLVIVGATPYLQSLSRVTARFPHTRVVVPDAVFDRAASFVGQRNVTGVKFADYEDGFLGGYLAGLMTPDGKKVSAVGGRPTEAVRDLIRGFEAGARRARPGMRVLVDYSRTFISQAPCEQLALHQIQRGSWVVFDVAGGCGFGVLDAAQIMGVWGLGVDSDLSSLNSHVLASVIKRNNAATELAVKLFASGHLEGGRDIRPDLASNGIGLVGINSHVPERVRTKVLELVARFRARDEARDAR